MTLVITKPKRTSVWVEQIAGRYRPISVHQIAMAWWLYQAKHLTARQFRIFFAAHEMHERRRYTKTVTGEKGGRAPNYTLDEVRALIGSQDSDTAIAGDVKALARVGLMILEPRSIVFAVSIEQIAIEDVSGFWAFFTQLPNTRRKVPMPRRTVRALARGFSKGVSAMVLAMLIRTLYWHRTGGKHGQGGYRIDGRTKCSWIADVFGLSRRTLTDARAALLDLGWITSVDCEQWELNKWGQRYILNVDGFGPIQEGGETDKSASPNGDLSDESASPCLNTSTPSTKELKTRRPAPMRSGSTVGSRKEKREGEPQLRAIVDRDLRETDRLLELHQQAVERGDPFRGEAGRLDFFALAERARRHSSDPPRLFAWLLRERRSEFITQADEDAASARLRRHREGPSKRESTPAVRKPKPVVLSEEAKRYAACLVAAEKKRLPDPFHAARRVFGWDREQWERAKQEYEQAQAERWNSH